MSDATIRCEVLVVGGGIAGAALGAHLARAGRKVLLLEAESHPGYHATGRSAAFWLESYGGSDIARLTAASRAFLDQPPANFSPHGFLHPRGAIHIAGEKGAKFDAIPVGVATERLSAERLRSLVPGLRPEWSVGLAEPGCREIDVAGLHQAYLASLKRAGGRILCDARLERAEQQDEWQWRLVDGRSGTARSIVDAAGAWADEVAERCGIRPLGFAPKRRTMVQLRIDRDDLAGLPLILDACGTFYFRGEGADSIWLSPHDEATSSACDAAPEELDVAEAIDRFQKVVDWKVLGVTRKWAGLRTFAPDRLPVVGWADGERRFFWYAGQGGTGIQTQPAAAAMGRALFLGEPPPLDPSPFDPRRFS